MGECIGMEGDGDMLMFVFFLLLSSRDMFVQELEVLTLFNTDVVQWLVHAAKYIVAQNVDLV